MLAYFLTEKNSWKNKYIFFAFFKVLDLNLIIFKKETFFVSVMGGVSGRYLTSFLDLTKNVGLSEGLFSGRLRHSREQKISNFGLRLPKNSRNLKKAEKLSKMSCFVMAFSGVLENNQAYRSQNLLYQNLLYFRLKCAAGAK